MLAEVLNLKGGHLEKKGPCPNCGGTDRFWIKPGKNQPIIFGCRQGCEFGDIIRKFEQLGIIDKKKLSPTEIKKRRLESKVSVQAYLWALNVVNLCAKEGGDLELAKKAHALLNKAEKVGVHVMQTDWAWDHAEIREKGVIDEHRQRD